MDFDRNVPLHTSPTNRVVNHHVIYSQKGGCHMTALDLRSTPTDTQVDESSFHSIYIYTGSHIA